MGQAATLACVAGMRAALVFATPVPGSPFKAGAGTVAVAVDPGGRFAYVSNNGAGATDPPTIRAYTIDSSTGALTLVTGNAVATGATPAAIGIEPSGRCLGVRDQRVHRCAHSRRRQSLQSWHYSTVYQHPPQRSFPLWSWLHFEFCGSRHG